MCCCIRDVSHLPAKIYNILSAYRYFSVAIQNSTHNVPARVKVLYFELALLQMRGCTNTGLRQKVKTVDRHE
jgi:hypothetical protein